MALNEKVLDDARKTLAMYVKRSGCEHSPLETQVSDLIADLLYLVLVDTFDPMAPRRVAAQADSDFYADLEECN